MPAPLFASVHSVALLSAGCLAFQPFLSQPVSHPSIYIW